MFLFIYSLFISPQYDTSLDTSPNDEKIVETFESPPYDIEKAESIDQIQARYREYIPENDFTDEDIDIPDYSLTTDELSKIDNDFLNLSDIPEDEDVGAAFIKSQESIDDTKIESLEEEASDDFIEDGSQAYLYEDTSNVLDYENNISIIDPTLNEYSKLRRIGKGRIEIKGDGINFFIDKKFFRFDFHQIEDIKSGDSFIALFIKGSEVVRLFLFEEGMTFKHELEQSIKNIL
ncbi:MAG: hypothetical protein SVZ03_15665 [Spirochaetota bacterium]|nr:hypothetical protein [Spirochaetota bacterium]